MKLKIFLFHDCPSDFEDTEEFEQKTIEENEKDNLYNFIDQYKDNKCCIYKDIEIEDIKDYETIRTFIYGLIIKDVFSYHIDIYTDFYMDFSFIYKDNIWKNIYNTEFN
jgi:hypothetical protein